ncbi:MAG TPA: hypothetical protein VES70_15425, partial [Pseudomonas sp.]|nr:hypothetical protein [Pseudomonas sp.]
AAPVWVDNVASLIEVKRRQRRLGKLHEGVREYVYYPGSFVPLSLIVGDNVALRQMAAPNQVLHQGGRDSSDSATDTLGDRQPAVPPARPSIDDRKRAATARQERRSGFGGLGATTLGMSAPSQREAASGDRARSLLGSGKLGALGLGTMNKAVFASAPPRSSVELEIPPDALAGHSKDGGGCPMVRRQKEGFLSELRYSPQVRWEGGCTTSTSCQMDVQSEF